MQTFKRISLLSLILALWTFPTGMFSATGSVGTAFGAKHLVSSVWLDIVSQNKTTIYNNGDSVKFSQTVATSSDVPNTATAKVDFVDYSNPAGIGYVVSARTATKTLAGGGQSTTYTFTLTTSSGNSRTGTITMQFKLDDVTGATAIDPLTREVSVAVQSQTGGDTAQ